jgi:ubiquinone/menaquinone biosynthesis C-methylase UbiE
MLKKTTNIEHYTKNEFDTWANREIRYYTSESYLVNQYFNKKLTTVDAGTAGGRLALALSADGFEKVRAFDFVEDFIKIARKKEGAEKIDFFVADACNLPLEDNSIPQMAYLQNIICCLESEADRSRALRESFRVCAPEGRVIFSFCGFETRMSSPSYRWISHYLKFVRSFTSKRPIQYFPYLRSGTRFSLRFLWDASPYMYWYPFREALQLLQKTGFTIEFMGSDRQVSEGRMWKNEQEINPELLSGTYYFICTKTPHE